MKIDSLVTSLLTEEARSFVRDHEGDDVHELSLKKIGIADLPTAAIAQQINGRQKAKTKLPHWYKNQDIIYPPGLNLEQSSSEATAAFKAGLIQQFAPKAARGADLTGGFGVDTWYLSLECAHIDFVETEEDLVQLAKHNHKALGATNISFHQTKAEDFLRSTSDKFDFIFVDPSRRKLGEKVFRLSDCLPDVVALRSILVEKAAVVIIKTSPLLDIQQGLRELEGVSDVYVVAVMNECKELLFVLRPNGSETKVHAVDLERSSKIISTNDFRPSEEKSSVVEVSAPQTYLYEPNAAILKAGAFKWVGAHFGLKKLAVNTHLYTSDKVIEFPGRIFQIVEHVKLDKKLRDRFDNGMANIISRNHPLSVEEIKKKTALKEGGTVYLICTQDSSQKYAFLAKRVRPI